MILEAIDISFSHHCIGKKLFHKANFRMDSSERVAIVAPRGTGKTTLCKILSGYEYPTNGKVLLDNKNILLYKGYCPVQMIWQHPEQVVNPRLKMKDILYEGGEIDKDIIKKLGIKDEWLNRFPGELSGGELQRFCIARALNKKTKFLIADEITTMFDLITQTQIWKIILDICEKREIGLIIISHSQPLIDKICTRQVNLEALDSL